MTGTTADRQPAGHRTTLVVLGAGGTSLYMASVARRTQQFSFVGFLDDDTMKQTEGYHSIPVLGPLTSWRDLPLDVVFLSSLYSPRKNSQLSAVVAGLDIPAERWATVVDPTAVILDNSSLGAGSFIGPHCTLEPFVRLGPRAVLLGHVYIAHHGNIGESVCCANSASISGGVTVGEGSYIGAGSRIREYVRVGRNALVGMGAAVISDVADGATVVGVPARTTSGHVLRSTS